MRIIKIIFLLLAFTSIFSCDENGLIVNCPDCFAEEPQATELEVKLDLPQSGQNILVNVYEGNVEDSVLYTTFRIAVSRTTISVTLNKKFTVTASYQVNNDFYTAIDSATPRVKYNKTQCTEPCYYVYDRVIDLRVKYYK